jgi:hypothetical protein
MDKEGHIGQNTWPIMLEAAGRSVKSDDIAGMFEFLGIMINETGHEKGFWSADVDTSDGTKFALMHSEISEAFESLRKPGLAPKSEKIPDFTEVEEELADAIIRILDWGNEHGYDIGAAIISKALYNRTRPRLHGKKF